MGDPAPASDLDMLLVAGDVGRELLASQPRLSFVQTVTAGYEGVDVDAASDLGIWVSSAPSGETGNAVSVAEFAVFLMIGASRNVLAEPMMHISPSLFGKSVCIVGLGSIGRLIVDRLQPFEMQIIAVDDRPERARTGVVVYRRNRIRDAIRNADYVVVCATGTKENENLIDAGALAAMKRGAIVVNVSRGLLVDEDALAAAVAGGHIAAAGLDVLKKEPPESSNPLLALPQVFVTPHIAGVTDMMLDGTVSYLARVVADVDAGRKPAATLNSPERPRRVLKAAA